MAAVERITEWLRRHTELEYHVTSGAVTVKPPNAGGFEVSLVEGESGWIVSFDGWHEHFTSEKEALDCFAFGLSDRCRLRISYRGSFPYRWTVEERTAEGWSEYSTTGLLFFPFWRRVRVEYRQNAIISQTEPGTAPDPAAQCGSSDS
ncbi:MAG: hypothetical protein NZU63_12635 [Gemmataceae bacterium]|nr:hypothetical protein [Gemmataceae bacterium]MDW8243249.1 hypothetical protein [Thermogemmata sp.]